MKNTHNKSDSEILRQKAEELLKKKSEDKILELIEELAFQNGEKTKRADELLIANKELAFQNGEKTKRADELLIANAIALKLTHELEVHQIELEMQNDELLAAQSAAAMAAEKYLELYDFAPTGYLSLSNLGKIIEINLYGAKILGKERVFLQGAMLGFFVSDNSKPVFNRFIEDVFTANHKESCEVTLLSKANLPIMVHLTGIVTEKGNQCLVSMVDITDRKQAEITIKESEEKYRNVFTAEKDALFLIDRSTHAILDVNDAACGLYGYSREEMLKLKNSDMSFEPEETRLATIEFKDRIDLRYHKKKDGTIFPVDISASLFIQKDKEVVLAAVRDITSQKHAEETLRESEENYRTLIENMGEGVGFLNSEETFVFANPAAEKIFGVDKGKLTGLCLNDFLLGKNIGIVNNEIRIRKQGKNSTYEIEIISKDGSKKDIMVTATPSFHDEKFIGTFGIFRDITDRKQAEEKIKHKNEQLIQANAEKDKFFSIISHDLRGPFNGFLGLSKILAEDLQNLTQEEIKKMSGGMRNSAINLFQLLENLLEWSRLQRGITSYEAEPFLLMPMIAESMQPVMDLADKKEIEISYEIPAGLEVFADKYMLASTIRNLASNAVKFTTKGGKVTIAAKTIPGHSVEISIRDTGIGMSPEMVADLFRLDTKTNRRGTENEPSSGLGLLLCKDFIEKHGGKLWVESEEGKGSVFYFTIPSNAEGLMKTVISNSVSNEEKDVQIKRIKILIAEDDEISASLISAMVDKYSHEVLHVNTGVDAIHACRNNPDIDLVLMDINLPGLDGFEATRQIRQFNNDMVIIAQTAFSLKFDRVMAIEAGCNDYISKPISISELKGLIRKYFTV